MADNKKELIPYAVYLGNLQEAKPSFTTDTFQAFVEAERYERVLFYRAMENGAEHMRAFVHWKNQVIKNMIADEIGKCNDRWQNHINTLLANDIAELERAWHTGDEEFDKFRKRIEYHDWYYDYSDDINVWRNGKADRDWIAKTAEEKGGLYKVCWDYAVKRQTLAHIKRQGEILQERATKTA